MRSDIFDVGKRMIAHAMGDNKSVVSPALAVSVDAEVVPGEARYLDTVEGRDSSSLGPTTPSKQTKDLRTEAAPANKAAVRPTKGETASPVSPSESRQWQPIETVAKDGTRTV